MQPPRGSPTDEQLLAEGRALRALARGLLGDDGDDAVQEGLAAAAARPDAARERGAWLAGAVRRLAARWRRDRVRRVAREAAVAAARGEVDRASDPARIAEAAETARLVAGAVHALDEPFRTTIVLRYWRGLSPERIAAELGVPRNTVRSRLQRGLERLRARLDERAGDGHGGWRGALAAFVGPREAAVLAPVAGGVVLIGAFMKTKLLLAAAALLAAGFVLWPDAGPAPAGNAVLAAAAGDPASAARAEVPLRDAAPREAVAVPPPAAAPSPAATAEPSDASPVKTDPWLARFLVVDDDDMPVGGATIAIAPAKLLPGDARSRELGLMKGNADAMEPAGAPLFELTTDRNGAATCTVALECVVASAQKDAQRSGHVTKHVVRGADVTRITLAALTTLRGVVLRWDGSPAAGATVTATVADIGSMVTGRAAQPEPVSADADGRFRMQATRGAGYSLEASLDGARTFRETVWHATPASPEVVLAFPGAITLQGLVVDADGGPAPAAEIRVWREFRADDPQQDPNDEEAAFSTADAQGRFRFDVRRHARYQLIAAREGHANSSAQWVETTAARPHAETRLRLNRPAAIRGTVRRGDGTARAGVMVTAHIDGPQASPSALPSLRDRFASANRVTTGDDGAFALTVHPDTRWTLVAHPLRDNLHFAFLTPDVAPGRGDVAITIDDAQLLGCVVRGHVSLGGGAGSVPPFDFELVRRLDGKWQRSRRPKVRIDGDRFELEALPLDREYALDVFPLAPDMPKSTARHTAAFAPARTRPFTTTANGVELEVRVAAWAEVPVRVLASDGSAATGLRVIARPDVRLLETWTAPHRIDAEGRAVLRRCVPGHHTILVVTADGATVHEHPAPITPGANPELVVRLPASTPR